MRMPPVCRTALFLGLLLAPVLHAGTFSTTAWTNDTTAGSGRSLTISDTFITDQTALSGNGSNRTFTVTTPADGFPKRFHRVQVE